MSHDRPNVVEKEHKRRPCLHAARRSDSRPHLRGRGSVELPKNLSLLIAPRQQVTQLRVAELASQKQRHAQLEEMSQLQICFGVRRASCMSSVVSQLPEMDCAGQIYWPRALRAQQRLRRQPYGLADLLVRQRVSIRSAAAGIACCAALQHVQQEGPPLLRACLVAAVKEATCRHTPVGSMGTSARIRSLRRQSSYKLS